MVSFTDMIHDLRAADIVFVGELHDSAEHHRLQLEIINQIHKSGRPTAVGLEMFRADSQRHLDLWVENKISLQDFLPIWHDNWRMPWGLYQDIFLFSRENRIPLIGLNVPSSITRKVAREGFASLTEEELKALPPGISCNIDQRYREFISRAYSDIAHRNGKRFEHFCEAQMVWDRAMAYNIVQYLKKESKRTVVALVGMGHAWRLGIPSHVQDMSRHSFRIVLPHIRGASDRQQPTKEDAHYIVLFERG